MIRQLCYSVPQTATFISLQVLLLCFEGTIIFCSRLKIHRKISLKKVTLKSGCLNCNVRNTLSSAHTFKVLRANQSIFLLGTKGTLKRLSRYV